MYRIKKEMSIFIKNKYIVDNLGLSNSYVSQLLKGKRTCPKHTAYAIASLYDKKIEDLFEILGGK